MSEAPAATSFIRIDNRIVSHYAPQIGPHALAVYVALAYFANASTRQCWPSISTLARLTGISYPSAQKAIHTLEAAGLIRVQSVWAEKGNRRPNRYTLLPPGSSQASPEGAPNDVGEGPQPALEEQDLINKNQENKRGRASAGRAPAPTRPAREAAPNPDLDHPAVKAYREILERTPNALQSAEIARVVTDVMIWRDVLRSWQLANYKKHNIPGMLDKYQREISERSGGSGRNARGGRPGFQNNRGYDRRESRAPEIPEETARLDAEWEAFRQSQNRSEPDGR